MDSPYDDPNFLILLLEQEDHSLKGYTKDFLALPKDSHYPDSFLCSLYFRELDNSTRPMYYDTSPTPDPEPSPSSSRVAEPQPEPTDGAFTESGTTTEPSSKRVTKPWSITGPEPTATDQVRARPVCPLVPPSCPICPLVLPSHPVCLLVSPSRPECLPQERTLETVPQKLRPVPMPHALPPVPTPRALPQVYPPSHPPTLVTRRQRFPAAPALILSSRVCQSPSLSPSPIPPLTVLPPSPGLYLGS
ncbi:vegetative cell wall protein gp1-like [Puntigrus tetrazona]|uniref:vegetative cell wall protein gp1-like n=1 Tax=Puntigrus tetrazona TaxID=1606681 RepID=UPI001C8978CB|nr:vegetative cell wall protein gp1-like [Puntigrus tetrazona]